MAPGQPKAVNVVKVAPKPEKNAYGGYGPVFKIEAPIVIAKQQAEARVTVPQQPETSPIVVANQLKAPSRRSPDTDSESTSNYVPSIVSRSYDNFMQSNQQPDKQTHQQEHEVPSSNPAPNASLPMDEDLASSMNDLRIQEAHQYAQKYSAMNYSGEGVVRAPRHPYDPVDEDDDDSSEGIDVDAPTPPPSVSRSLASRPQPSYPVTTAFSYHKPAKQQLRKIPEATQM